MIPTITIDNIISSISLILVTISTLRAASRLEYRLNNHGSLGLMDGPPILGPSIVRNTQQSREVVKQQIEDGANNELDDIKDTNNIGDGKDTSVIEASPLWEHTEAFRRAVILGLIFDNNKISTTEDSNRDSCIFSNIIRNEEEKNVNNVRGGSNNNNVDDLAAAGLLLSSTTSVQYSGRRRRSFSPRSLVRGGFQKKSKATTSKDKESNNPISKITTWFIRELSAPIEAIPTWHKLFSSYLNEQKKEGQLNRRRSSSGKAYDSSILDCNSFISGIAHIPSCDKLSDSSSPTKSIRVKAFAPQTFKDLRNKCFRVKEKEYAKSILNAMNGVMSIDDIDRGDRPILENDDSMSNILRAILKGKPQQKNKKIRRGTIQTLPYISFQSNSKGAARVGTFFFFTADGAFMVKTIKKEEANAFLEMLPEYHKFMSDNVNGRNSLLTRIFGMYSVQFISDEETKSTGDDRWDGGLYSPSNQHEQATTDLADDERVYLVMHSIFPPAASTFITERFDLKGSTVGRKCSIEERQSKGANAVLKDLDLMKEVEEELDEANNSGRDVAQKKKKRNKSSQHGICIGRRRKNALMAQLERDVDLLHRCNVLDYSLLVGVADMELSQGKGSTNLLNWLNFPMPYFGAGMTTVDGGALSALPGTRRGKHVTYFLGVIDFLQPWTVKKRLERDLKGLAGYDKTAISCVAPVDYAARFLNFCNTHVT